MKIALVGYGKMGKIIEQIALERNHTISHKINSTNKGTSWKDSDVAIEFSQPKYALENIKKSIAYSVPIVVGTTGWKENLPKIEENVLEAELGLFHASNFSLGVNIFYQINKHLARIMSDHESYQVSMEESHHLDKLDKPSGTAIVLANQIIDNHDSYEAWTLDDKNERAISIEVQRMVNVKGDHSIIYENEIDKIEIKHSAKNRRGFALGAILAAEFLQDRTGVFTMDDLLKF